MINSFILVSWKYSLKSRTLGLTINLHEVHNLDAVLPLCSTPVPIRRHVSASRALLPLEQRPEHQASPIFRRMNIFKKRQTWRFLPQVGLSPLRNITSIAASFGLFYITLSSSSFLGEGERQCPYYYIYMLHVIYFQREQDLTIRAFKEYLKRVYLPDSY